MEWDKLKTKENPRSVEERGGEKVRGYLSVAIAGGAAGFASDLLVAILPVPLALSEAFVVGGLEAGVGGGAGGIRC